MQLYLRQCWLQWQAPPPAAHGFMLSSMSEYFLSTGADMQIMHRLISIAAGSLDSMPHATGIFLFNDYLGTTHKEIYWHCFWTALVPPAIIALVGAMIFTVIA